jgi:hypothetical protein
MIEIKLYEYQVNELLIILNTIIHEFKEEKEKPENACILSFYEIKISIYERIRKIFEDSFNKERKKYAE